MKSILKYTIVFIMAVLILLAALVLAAKIPKNLVIENIKEISSWEYDKNVKFEVYELIHKKDYTYRHVYADAMLANIIYYLDETKPLKSVMEAKYYSTDGWKSITYDFNKLIDRNYPANMQYIRYWHGSISILKPLLVFFNMNQVYILFSIVFAILTMLLLILLIKTKIKELVIAYIVGLIMCVVVVVPLCIEYYWTFLIMTIGSIIAIVLEKKNKNLNMLFFLIGILTCYFDFLTTELVTFLVPIIIILTIRYKQNKISKMKEGLKFLVVSTIFWSIGYVGMWFAKWILASIILNVNITESLINDIMLRITGKGTRRVLPGVGSMPNLWFKAISKNFQTIFPFDLIREGKLTYVFLISLIVLELIFIRKKDLKKLWFSALLIIIAILPYIRYAILASHSYTHYFFTFRSQIISIMAIILAIIYSMDKETMKKSIKFGRKKCI